ncbi:DinB family protein [Flavobacterium sp. ZS1P14]|uniref:DinB family protein n=1 Tax=Flavobacterium sp. ZS1P14 TaxID=3401729 RepID=UPI003AAB2F07
MNRQGAVGALLDVYEQAILDFKKVIEDIPDTILTRIVDPETTDKNCKSIQSILSHMVNSGYGYAIYIHNLKGHNMERPDKVFHISIKEYLEDFNKLIVYTENVFKDIEDSELEQLYESKKIVTSWKQLYDIEQLMEHAIVHILRHQRQIEKLKRNLLQ